MAKYHINDKKEVGVCKASVKDCKFGNAGEHFNDEAEAQKEADRQLAKEYGVVSAAYKAGGEQDDRVKAMKPELKKRMIEDSASGKAPLAPAVVGKVFANDRDELVRRRVSSKITSQNLLRKMSDDESAKVRANVAATTNNPHVLRKLAQDEDSTVRNAALKNQRMPKRDKKKTIEAVKAAAVAKRKATVAKPLERAEPVADSSKAEVKANEKPAEDEKPAKADPWAPSAKVTGESKSARKEPEVNHELMYVRDRDLKVSHLRAMTDSQLASRKNSTFRLWCNGGPKGPFTKVEKVLAERNVKAPIHLRPDE